MAPTPQTTRTRWQITNLPILRALPEVSINDRPRADAGAARIRPEWGRVATGQRTEEGDSCLILVLDADAPARMPPHPQPAIRHDV